MHIRNTLLLCIVLCFMLSLGCQGNKEISILKNEATVEEYDLEFAVQLGGEGFVVGHDERGAIEVSNHVCPQNFNVANRPLVWESDCRHVLFLV